MTDKHGRDGVCDPKRITAELLRQMIDGEHPVDLRLMRFCATKLDAGQAAREDPCACEKLIDAVEMLDLAMQFKAPPRLVAGLRSDAATTLGCMLVPACADERD